MSPLKFKITDETVQAFPAIRVGGFLVADLDHAATGIAGLLDGSAVASNLRDEGLDLTRLADEPRIAAWRSAITEMGLKPSTFKSSPEQLVRRSLKGQPVMTPLAIVNAYCSVSAKFVSPIGGYDLARLPAAPIELRFAQPDVDEFKPLGGRAEDMPLGTKVAVYAADATVLCFGFNVRDSAATCLMPNTTDAVFFGEAVAPSQWQALEQALAALRAAIVSAGGVATTVAWADSASSEFELSGPVGFAGKA